MALAALPKWGPEKLSTWFPWSLKLWSQGRGRRKKSPFIATGSQRKRWKVDLVSGQQQNNNNKEENERGTGWKVLLHICRSGLVGSLGAGTSHTTPTVTKQKSYRSTLIRLRSATQSLANQKQSLLIRKELERKGQGNSWPATSWPHLLAPDQPFRWWGY